MQEFGYPQYRPKSKSVRACLKGLYQLVGGLEVFRGGFSFTFQNQGFNFEPNRQLWETCLQLGCCRHIEFCSCSGLWYVERVSEDVSRKALTLQECVRACVGGCVRAWVCVRVYVCTCVRVYVCVCVCVTLEHGIDQDTCFVSTVPAKKWACTQFGHEFQYRTFTRVSVAASIPT